MNLFRFLLIAAFLSCYGVYGAPAPTQNPKTQQTPQSDNASDDDSDSSEEEDTNSDDDDSGGPEEDTESQT